MSLSKFKNVKILGTVVVTPQNNINIDDEIAFYENSKMLERNKKILGLGTRHVVTEGVTASTLCEEAAKILIKEKNIDISEIDTLIMTSINHDYNGNSDACIIQGNLGLNEECACFDTSGLGCTDVVYGLWLAHSLIQSGASKKCLFLEGSTSSLLSDVDNRNSNMLFGDAGSATILEFSEEENPAYFHLQSHGKDWKKIVTPAGGFRFPIRKDIIDIKLKDIMGNPINLWDSIMDGTEVFKFAIATAPNSINKVLEYSNNTIEDIDFFAIHQANAQIVRTVIMHSGLPRDKSSSKTFTKYGNCGGTSVLMNFCDEMKNSEKDYSKIAFVSFGVGLSTASCILNIKPNANLGVRFYEPDETIETREEMIKNWIKFIEGEKNV